MALFFAVDDLSKNSGTAYLLHDVEYMDDSDSDPFKIDDVIALKPSRLTPSFA